MKTMLRKIALLIWFTAFFAVGCKTCVDANAMPSNLDMGVPSHEDCQVDRLGYSLGFRDTDKQPAWVSYVIIWSRL